MLARAVESVVSQGQVSAFALLVVNGGCDDVSELESMRAVRVLRLAEPSLPKAILAGRTAVKTPFFSILDDDDYLLPGALAARIAMFERYPAIDAVVTNGFVCRHGSKRPFFDDMDRVNRDPLGEFARDNWLSPGSALFRSQAVPAALFRDIPRYLEWTYIGTRLVMRNKLRFTNAMTFVHNEDTPGSISGSVAYIRGQPAALRRILEMDLPEALRIRFEHHMAMALHDNVLLDMREGNRRGAWFSHAKCLIHRGGWRYLPFTRKLLGVG